MVRGQPNTSHCVGSRISTPTSMVPDPATSGDTFTISRQWSSCIGSNRNPLAHPGWSTKDSCEPPPMALLNDTDRDGPRQASTTSPLEFERLIANSAIFSPTSSSDTANVKRSAASYCLRRRSSGGAHATAVMLEAMTNPTPSALTVIPELDTYREEIPSRRLSTPMSSSRMDIAERQIEHRL